MVIPSSLPLRGYQQETIDAVTTAWAGGDRPTGTGVVNRVGVVMATGLGKTVIFAHLCLMVIQILMAQARGAGRVLVLVHRDELAQQAKNKIHSVAPHLRVGIVMAGRNEVEADVIIASVQTIGPALVRWAEGRETAADRRRTRAHDIRGVGLIIVDEAHHAAAPTWRAVLKHFGAFDGVPTAGFTATMSREDSRGLGEIWDEVVYKRDTLWGIQNGYLSDVRGIRLQVPGLDLNGVHVRAGDLQQEETAAEMLDANTGEAIAKGLLQEAPGRRPVVFAPNVATALDFAGAINDVGIKTETILGSTPIVERREIYDRYRTGVTQCLTNNLVLTEGWDAPWADCAVIARPTKSAGLYQQMVGRVLRPWRAGGKVDALVIDVVGVTTRHHLASLIDLSPDRPVRERQSVLEAWDEFDDYELTEQADGPADYFAKVDRVIGTKVDLLSAAVPSPWLQTRAGTWFIPAGDLLFFLWPEVETSSQFDPGPTATGLVTVGVCSAERFERSTPLKTRITFEMAMTWAEALAAEESKPKTAKWRNGSPPASLIKDARKLGLPGWTDTRTAGPVYDGIWIERASRRLDR